MSSRFGGQGLDCLISFVDNIQPKEHKGKNSNIVCHCFSFESIFVKRNSSRFGGQGLVFLISFVYNSQPKGHKGTLGSSLSIFLWLIGYSE